MGKYRKKPVVVEAIRLTPELLSNVLRDTLQHPDWFSDAKSRRRGEIGAVWRTLIKDDFDKGLFVGTLEGVCWCPLGHWIVRGVRGELYPVESGIFEATYEPVEERSE